MPVSDFYARPVLEVARDLVGCEVSHGGAAGIIVETEAYHESEPACHAFVGVTPRTRVLFGPPGTAYVYRSYGIHALLNAVCEEEGVGAAVLIRALEPTAGLARMAERRGRSPNAPKPGDGPGAGAFGTGLCDGPGKLTQALGIGMGENATSLLDGPVRIAVREPLPVVTGRRIGITKAAELPWRFCAVGNPHVSRPWPRP